MKYTSKKNIHTADARKLKYCDKCYRVWEKALTGTILKYRNLPTHGLPRVACNSCSKLKESIEKDGRQITKWLSFVNEDWLKSECDRLNKKDWKVEIQKDNRGMIALWRIR